MSRDRVPEDQAVRDLEPQLRRIAYALEQLVSLKMGTSRSSPFVTCLECGCTIVAGKHQARVPCPVCGTPAEVP